jgi:hypothetical protein
LAWLIEVKYFCKLSIVIVVLLCWEMLKEPMQFWFSGRLRLTRLPVFIALKSVGHNFHHGGVAIWHAIVMLSGHIRLLHGRKMTSGLLNGAVALVQCDGLLNTMDTESYGLHKRLIMGSRILIVGDAKVKTLTVSVLSAPKPMKIKSPAFAEYRVIKDVS